jgi:hypothetical protein
MQYGAVLPVDYEMERMRERVRQNGHLLDDRHGISFKAYLMRERGKGGSPVNYYGSFYLWNDTAAMTHFLVGGGAFERIILGLGRLPVEYWMCLSTIAGNSPDSPTAAFRSTMAIPAGLDLAADGLGLSRFVEEQRQRLAEYGRSPDLHTGALALDPKRWELVWFAAGTDALHMEGDCDRFEVLHVSQPDRHLIRGVEC